MDVLSAKGRGDNWVTGSRPNINLLVLCHTNRSQGILNSTQINHLSSSCTGWMFYFKGAATSVRQISSLMKVILLQFSLISSWHSPRYCKIIAWIYWSHSCNCKRHASCENQWTKNKNSLAKNEMVFPTQVLFYKWVFSNIKLTLQLCWALREWWHNYRVMYSNHKPNNPWGKTMHVHNSPSYLLYIASDICHFTSECAMCFNPKKCHKLIINLWVLQLSTYIVIRS